MALHYNNYLKFCNVVHLQKFNGCCTITSSVLSCSNEMLQQLLATRKFLELLIHCIAALRCLFCHPHLRLTVVNYYSFVTSTCILKSGVLSSSLILQIIWHSISDNTCWKGFAQMAFLTSWLSLIVNQLRQTAILSSRLSDLPNPWLQRIIVKTTMRWSRFLFKVTKSIFPVS